MTGLPQVAHIFGWAKALLLALLVMCVVPSVRAQDGTGNASTMEEARALFMAGDAAARAERWSDAYQNFARAYELSGNPVAQFNAAFALRSLGRYREVRDALTALLESQGSDLPEELVNRMTAMRDEAQARLSRLVLQGLRPGEQYTIRLDGRRFLDDGSRPLVLEVDGGERNLVVGGATVRPYEWSGVLRAGQRLELTVPYQPAVTEVVERRDPLRDPVSADSGEGEGEGEDDGGTVFESPIFWTVVGVVVVGAGVGAALVLTSDSTLDPESNRVTNL